MESLGRALAELSQGEQTGQPALAQDEVVQAALVLHGQQGEAAHHLTAEKPRPAPGAGPRLEAGIDFHVQVAAGGGAVLEQKAVRRTQAVQVFGGELQHVLGAIAAGGRLQQAGAALALHHPDGVARHPQADGHFGAHRMPAHPRAQKLHEIIVNRLSVPAAGLKT